MQSLRSARLLARLVLAWLALAIGVAAAAPLVQPQSIELICSGGGAMKLLVKGDDGDAATPGLTLDCPLCASFDAPAPPQCVTASPLPPGLPVPAGFALPSAARTSVAPPARGPPFFAIG